MIPAGLIDSNVELFASGNQLMAIYNGKAISFRLLPFDIIKKFLNDMLANPEAIDCLHKMGHTSISAMLERYCMCRFGGFDGNADLNCSSNETKPEHWDCGNRENCPYQYKICSRVWYNGVYLTLKQVQIVKLIASGFPDKIVSDMAGITLQTLLTHKKNIYSKLNLHSQSDITAFAFRNNLIA